MEETMLAHAVEQFARRTHTLSDADLERDWSWGEYSEGIAERAEEIGALFDEGP